MYSWLGCKVAIHHHPGFPQCGQDSRTVLRHSTLGGDLAAAVKAMTVVGVSNCQFILEAPLYQLYAWLRIIIDQDYSVE